MIHNLNITTLSKPHKLYHLEIWVVAQSTSRWALKLATPDYSCPGVVAHFWKVADESRQVN